MLILEVDVTRQRVSLSLKATPRW
ncbi:hypothetical protein ACQPZJ_44560 [Actinoplanes sp. CA-054009]